jgi:hypothetical protein
MHRGRHLLDLPPGSGALFQADWNVTVALALLLASALLGLATGRLFRVWALVPLSVLTAIASAISLQARGFEFAGGVSITIGCIVIGQIAYIFAGLVLFGPHGDEDLTQEVDDGPYDRGEHDVRRQDE